MDWPANCWPSQPKFFLQFTFSCNSLVHDPGLSLSNAMVTLFFASDSSYEVQKGDDDDDAFPNYKEGLGSSEWTKVVIRVPKLRKILI